MNFERLSDIYKVRRLSEGDIDEILSLCSANPLYYKHCPPSPTGDTIKADMAALPPNKTCEDKYYLGFYGGEELVAVLDLIMKYPNDSTAFFGFFMLNNRLQGAGVGSKIISKALEYLSSIDCKSLRLGYVKGNPQAKGFWEKNGFTPTGVESVQEDYTVVIMEKQL